jgi:EAL domain-containing protein (putative c-di-GMP-specific phosphodiesterase class I)
VQDEATIDLLRDYGVDFAQGFHIGEPRHLVIVRRRTQTVGLELFPAVPAVRERRIAM